MARTHYDVLQVRPEASAEEIQQAYRKLALQYHPDRNPAPDAAFRMAAINEAYEILRASVHRESTNPPATKPTHNDDLTFSILSAARAVVLRNGWTVSHEESNIVVFEIGNPRIRIILTERLTNDSLLRLTRQYRELAAVLTVHFESPIGVNPGITVIDLMRAERHGALIPDGPCKSLLSGFL